MKTWSFLRLILVVLSFFLLYVLIFLKLFYWQVVRGDELASIGKNQNTELLNITASRGEILSSDKYPLATNKTTYLLYGNPKTIKGKDEYAKKLSSALSFDESSISAALSKDLFWVKIAHNLTDEEKRKVESLNLSALGFQDENTRLFPEASMAAHLIGFVGKDKEGQNKGYFGIEGFYDGQLKGRSGKFYVVRDALGNPMINDVREEKKIEGRSLVLSIDRTIQYFVEKKLKEGIEKYQTEGGSVVVMEPQSGKIIAMASRPSFDPQKDWEFPSEYYKNPVVSSLYEPGSTFKVLVMSAALDAGVLKPETKCNICDEAITIGEYKIKTWNDKYYKNTSMTEVIQHSDNTGMVFVGRKLGVEKLIQYLKLFGIGELTDIDIQGEISGEIRDISSWYPVDLATVSFGQGITATPIQLVAAVSAIANEGNLVKPYVVEKIITEEGKTIEIKPETRQRVISEKTAKVMTWMMVNAVENGEAKWTKISGHKIAGKTGTAQIPVAGHYDPDKTVTSFVGFFPAEKPRFSMLVIFDRPKTSIYGSETAAPVFFNIARDIINYYNIPPSY